MVRSKLCFYPYQGDSWVFEGGGGQLCKENAFFAFSILSNKGLIFSDGPEHKLHVGERRFGKGRGTFFMHVVKSLQLCENSPFKSPFISLVRHRLDRICRYFLYTGLIGEEAASSGKEKLSVVSAETTANLKHLHITRKRN